MICHPAPSTTADVSKYHALGLVYVSAAVLAYKYCSNVQGMRMRARKYFISTGVRAHKSVHAQKSVTDKHTYYIIYIYTCTQIIIHTNAKRQYSRCLALRRSAIIVCRHALMRVVISRGGGKIRLVTRLCMDQILI